MRAGSGRGRGEHAVGGRGLRESVVVGDDALEVVAEVEGDCEVQGVEGAARRRIDAARFLVDRVLRQRVIGPDFVAGPSERPMLGGLLEVVV